MRLGTYNVEWFTNLFNRADQVLADHHRSARHDVTRREQVEAIGRVMRYADADLMLIVEAPDSSRSRSTITALENFARHQNLRTTRAAMGFTNQTEQELAVLYDPDKVSVTHRPLGEVPTGKTSRTAPRFDTVFRIDLDNDGVDDAVTFSKPPIELEVRTAAGATFSLIGVHVKSKAPHGARTEKAIMRLSIENRKKALAQSIWLRARIAEHLSKGDSLVVMGDLNDGPGLDEYEQLFGRSSVEILMGEGNGAQLYDPHAAVSLQRKGAPAPTTSRFYLAHENRYMEALLDYIMLSGDLVRRNAVWRILHPFDDPDCFANDGLRNALLTASDHFPVLVDLDL